VASGSRYAVEAEVQRYTAAVGMASDLESLLEALRAREGRRQTLRAELAALDGHRRGTSPDRRALEQRARATLADWSGLMTRQATETRTWLQRALEERIVFTPREAAVEFAGQLQLGPMLAGLIPLPLVGGVPGGMAPSSPRPAAATERTILALPPRMRREDAGLDGAQHLGRQAEEPPAGGPVAGGPVLEELRGPGLGEHVEAEAQVSLVGEPVERRRVVVDRQLE
jgi:hypothetical protein